MPKIVVISGQTASGKSELSLSLAKKYNGIVINADSRQIYKELNIGTAKPIPQSISKDKTWYIDNIPHYLFGFASIETEYNIYKYQKDVQKIIERNPNKTIFLVGGTGLYIDSIIHGYILPTLEESILEYRNLDLTQLKELVGERINQLNESDRENPRRLITLLKQNEKPKTKPLSSYIYLVLDVESEILKERIAKRVEAMFNNGLIQENEEIYKRYPDYSLPSLNTIGYKEFKEYFEKKITVDQVKELVRIHTNQYAKRQKTWFKRNNEAIYIKSLEEADQAVSNFLKNL